MDKIETIIRGVYSFFTNADLGSFASIIGTMVSFYVLHTVRDMRTKMYLNTRFPKLIDDLSGIASSVSRDLSDYPAQKNEIDVALERCTSHLKSLATKVPGSTKPARSRLLQLLKEYRDDDHIKDEKHVRQIYVSLNGVIQDLKNLNEDFKLE